MPSIVVANVYDYPQYFDLLFRDETQMEADFIDAAMRKYGRPNSRRVLEPGCGGGRLVVEMAQRGYEVAAFDGSLPALEYLRQQLELRQLRAEVFASDLAKFELVEPVDAAFCTFNTFRHLLTDDDAANHLRCVEQSLRPGGIYILGFHLLPLDVDEECIERWTGRDEQTAVTVTLRVLATNRRKRLEQIRLSILIRTASREQRMRTEFPLRMYTAAQFRKLLRAVPEFELCDVFDFWYDLDDPLKFNDEITDTIFVLRKKSEIVARRSAS